MHKTPFSHKTLPGLHREVFRLGLSSSFGIDAQAYEAALERGFDYLFWVPYPTSRLRTPLRRALKARRENYVLATGPMLGYFGGSVRRSAESILRSLGTEYIDVFHLFWLGKTSAWTSATQTELFKLKEEGKVKSIGISIHDRDRANVLMQDSPIDLFMLRYNAAHPGAERDIFAHRDPNAPTRKAVVAYTATSWRKLLKKPNGWEGRSMTAGDCYRFCLSNPHVDVVLTGVDNLAQLDENMAAIEKGPLSAEEEAWMRRFGAVVHG